ncbi:unnamed protein product [Cylicocyclus nassatus]|uniref:Phospholipid/glycerol acyltransferase domain-containing protein n=1 Tax=Cylicocyclus nassatus TaxID=53992 RepID=A0AA36MFA9_CYLNA|nr:unnamed protein product [Cylicocyclus nassatus]
MCSSPRVTHVVPRLSGMILELLAIYGSILLGCIISTTFLILIGKSWGPLPHYYLGIVRWIQRFYPKVYPKSHAPYPAIVKKDPYNSLMRDKETSSSHFPFLTDPRDSLKISLDALHSGIEAIVQDNVAPVFGRAPTHSQSLLRMTPYPQWTKFQKALFYLTVIFRWTFLFPIRLAFLLLSFAFLIGAVIIAVNRRLTDKEKTWVGIVYSRLFCCSMGVVASFRNKHLRPKGPGVAVANHMTPNDAQILFSNTPVGSSYGYVITGQKHEGIIGSMETLASSLCPTYWVERENKADRREFLTEIIKKSQFGGPILLFPEGYCSNNTQVLQFRKAIFDDGVRIYPIAIKQRSRYGDSFWFDDLFYMYLLRVMSSWAIYYDVTYLPSMIKLPTETKVEFAARTQAVICDVVGVPAGQFDGSMFYSKTMQERVRTCQREICANALRTFYFGEEKTEEEDSKASESIPAQVQDDRPIVVN